MTYAAGQEPRLDVDRVVEDVELVLRPTYALADVSPDTAGANDLDAAHRSLERML